MPYLGQSPKESFDAAISQTITGTGATLEVMGGQKYILEANDDLQFKSDTADSLDVVMGVMEITS